MCRICSSGSGNRLTRSDVECAVGNHVVNVSRILDRVIFLKQGSLFAGMKSGDLRALAAIAEELHFEPGQYAVRENELGDSLYVIREGRMAVTKAVGGTDEVILTTLSGGDCFGDMSIFDAEVRSAGVKADEHCRLLRIGRDDMLDILNEHPGIGIELIRIFVKRLRNANGKIEELSSANTAEGLLRVEQ